MYARIKRGASGRGITAVSEDGSSFFVPKSVVEDHALVNGQELEEHEFEQLRDICQLITAKQKALDLLAMRDHSIEELKLKLKQRSFSEGIIESVISYLLDRRYLDDTRFAEIWIRARLRKKPESRQMLLAGLMKKGVNRDIAQNAIDTAGIDDDSIVEQAVTRFSKRNDDPQKLMQRLARKGFPYGLVKKYVNRFFSEDQ